VLSQKFVHRLIEKQKPRTRNETSDSRETKMATRNISKKAPVSDQEPVSPSELRSRGLTRTRNRTIRVTTCRSWEQLEERIPGWEAILRENQSLSIFSTPEWLGSWWKAFGSEKQMTTLAFSNEDNALMGLAPLYVEDITSPVFGKLAHLRFIGDGSGDSDNLDLIVRPGFKNVCAQALLHWLAQHQDWDLCSLNTVSENSVMSSALMNELERTNWPFISGTCPNSKINLPESWLQYVQRLSPNFRPLVTRYPHKLARRYEVRIRRCEERNDLPTALEAFFSLHTKRWNLADQPGSFGSVERREFYQHVSQCFLHRGWLELWILQLNGAAAAAQFCFRYGDTVYALQEGFDPEFAADKVGYALRSAMLKHFIETGVARYDFLGGLAEHKQKWGAEPGSYLNLHFARPGSRGSLYLFYTDIAARSKEWLRRNLPTPAWSVLHKLNLKLNNRRVNAASIQENTYRDISDDL
jgi:CelD/BcsL family acetyltransferase involved in cellulose biosynthesis